LETQGKAFFELDDEQELAKAQLGLRSWQESLVKRLHDMGESNFGLVEFHQDSPFYNFSVTKFEAKDTSLNEIFNYTAESLGADQLSRYIDDLAGHEHNFAGRAISTKARVLAQLNSPKQPVTLTVPHERLFDIMVAQNAELCALGDQSLINQTNLVINIGAAGITYRGYSVVDIATMSGNLRMTLPARASEFGISQNIIDRFNKKALKELAEDRRKLSQQGKSMLQVVALNGSTAKRQPPIGPTECYVLPTIDPQLGTKTLVSGSLLLPRTLFMPNLAVNKPWYKINDPIEISRGINEIKMSQLKQVMYGFAEELSRLSKKPVTYDTYTSLAGIDDLTQHFGSTTTDFLNY
jgi:hypothetical protein